MVEVPLDRPAPELMVLTVVPRHQLVLLAAQQMVVQVALVALQAGLQVIQAVTVRSGLLSVLAVVALAV